MCFSNDKELLNNWKIRCEIAQKGHYLAGEWQTWYHYICGFCLIVCTSALSIMQLHTISNNLIEIVCGLVATILSNIQIFYNFKGKALEHHNSAVEYGKLRRKIEGLMVGGYDDLNVEVGKLTEDWNGIVETAPITPRRLVKKSERDMEKNLRKTI